MRTLYLTRHAKSSWDDTSVTDHDRPLNPRGLRDAPFMARVFAERKEPLDLLVSSPAARAWATATFFARALRVPLTEVRSQPRAYHASSETLLAIVNDLPDTARRVMLFGHNPGLSVFCEELCDNGPGDLVTCHTVRIDLDVERWSHVCIGSGTMRWHDHPKGHAALQ